jgi:hypothetical protein
MGYVREGKVRDVLSKFTPPSVSFICIQWQYFLWDVVNTYILPDIYLYVNI